MGRRREDGEDIKKQNEGANTQKKLQLQIGLFLSRIKLTLKEALRGHKSGKKESYSFFSFATVPIHVSDLFPISVTEPSAEIIACTQERHTA